MFQARLAELEKQKEELEPVRKQLESKSCCDENCLICVFTAILFVDINCQSIYIYVLLLLSDIKLEAEKPEKEAKDRQKQAADGDDDFLHK